MRITGELRRVYGNDVELLDQMVGMYAEDPPRGFAFSDIAFRLGASETRSPASWGRMEAIGWYRKGQ